MRVACRSAPGPVIRDAAASLAIRGLQSRMQTIPWDLQKSVLAELLWEPGLDSSRIGVAVEQGVVALTDKVSTLAQRQATEAAVKRVRGVSAVANDLEPDDRLTVTVTKGCVTLEGEVDFPRQRFAAESAVEILTGVRGVSNKIVVKPIVAAADVRRQLTAALHRQAQLDANAVHIDVREDAIKLSGTVTSWAERDRVQDAAWCVPGVAHVDNQLAVKVL
jgi:osmotically-inducible protein OsmY